MVAVGRLSLGIGSAYLVITILDLKGVAAGTVFLMATMPTAIINFVLADRYQHNARQVAGAVVASTLVTFACLPLLIWTALSISGGNTDGGGRASFSLSAPIAEANEMETKTGG